MRTKSSKVNFSAQDLSWKLDPDNKTNMGNFFIICFSTFQSNTSWHKKNKQGINNGDFCSTYMENLEMICKSCVSMSIFNTFLVPYLEDYPLYRSIREVSSMSKKPSNTQTLPSWKERVCQKELQVLSQRAEEQA